MKQRLKTILVLMIIVGISSSVYSQGEASSKDSPWSFGTDVVSRYVWRGLHLGGSSPAIQPNLQYSFGNEDHVFAVGAWGSYAIVGAQTGQEADLFLTYTMKDIVTVSVIDYFFPHEASSTHDFFNFNPDQTKHLLEASIGFNGTKRIPISILFAMNVWGDDARKYEEQSGMLVASDNIVMSKYLELAYSADIKGIGLDVFTGFSLDNPDTDKGVPYGFYGQESAGMINLGIKLTKEIQLTQQYSLPVFGSLILNPEAGNIFIVFGLSF